MFPFMYLFLYSFHSFNCLTFSKPKDSLIDFNGLDYFSSVANNSFSCHSEVTTKWIKTKWRSHAVQRKWMTHTNTHTHIPTHTYSPLNFGVTLHSQQGNFTSLPKMQMKRLSVFSNAAMNTLKNKIKEKENFLEVFSTHPLPHTTFPLHGCFSVIKDC